MKCSNAACNNCCPLTACMTQPKVARVLTVLSRLALSSIFIMAGVGKIFNYVGTQGYMGSVGVPGGLLPLVIALELGGGLLLLLGYRARTVALLLAGFTLIAGFIFHRDFADHMQLIMFMKNIAIVGGLLQVVIYGAGVCALDNVCCKAESCCKKTKSCCDKQEA